MKVNEFKEAMKEALGEELGFKYTSFKYAEPFINEVLEGKQEVTQADLVAIDERLIEYVDRMFDARTPQRFDDAAKYVDMIYIKFHLHKTVCLLQRFYNQLFCNQKYGSSPKRPIGYI